MHSVMDGWTDQWTNRPTDKVTYRVACMQLKTEPIGVYNTIYANAQNVHVKSNSLSMSLKSNIYFAPKSKTPALLPSFSRSPF